MHHKHFLQWLFNIHQSNHLLIILNLVKILKIILQNINYQFIVMLLQKQLLLRDI